MFLANKPTNLFLWITTGEVIHPEAMVLGVTAVCFIGTIGTGFY